MIGAFIDLPPKKDYPEYYDYISDPIDMTMIEQKINTDRVSVALSSLSAAKISC